LGKELYISADHDGRRLDRVLRTLWPQVPLGVIMKAIRKGEVRLDAKKAQPDTRLEEGQFLQVPWDDGLASETRAVALQKNHFPKLETLYKDDFVWVINKPAGLLTQTDEKGGDSLVTRALAELAWNRADFRPSAVQRLDRNTSGVILVALTGQAQRILSEMIRERLVKKIYWAVVSGELPEHGEVNASLLKDQAANKVVADERGQKALTRFTRLASGGGWSAAELELVTGRPHQARAHMAHIGRPILGDVKYGGSQRDAKRPLLHARKLTFPNDAVLPQELRAKTLTAPLPADMTRYFAQCSGEKPKSA
jgi:23S rRNA pseudouridine955/2504/2580 synthase